MADKRRQDPDARSFVPRKRPATAETCSRFHLSRMARLAADGYLREQGRAVAEAMEVIEETRHAARDPRLPASERLSDGRIGQQRVALHDALAVLGSRERGKRKARRARLRRERAQAVRDRSGSA